MGDIYSRLVYYSRNTIPGPEAATALEIGRILDASRRNNPRAEVTGALMFNNGCFAQVLEGPRAAVEATFERIQRDARHAEVVVLQVEEAAGRAFPNWSMAFVGRSDAGRDLFGHIAAASGFADRRLAADRVLETLREIVADEERRAA